MLRTAVGSPARAGLEEVGAGQLARAGRPGVARASQMGGRGGTGGVPLRAAVEEPDTVSGDVKCLMPQVLGKDGLPLSAGMGNSRS
jgi:hypothetical protein